MVGLNWFIASGMTMPMAGAAAYIKPVGRWPYFVGRWPYFIGKLNQLSAEFLR